MNVSATNICVFLVDDHPALRFGIAALVNSSRDMSLAGEATTGAEAVAAMRLHPPNVAVIDCLLPDMPGAAVAQALVEANLPTRVLALSGYTQAHFMGYMYDAGAAGYIVKEHAPWSIIGAIRQVATGAHLWGLDQLAEIKRWREAVQRPWLSLTERERVVILGVAKGEGNREIAEHLHVTERTVEFHVSNILGKLAVPSRTAAVAWIKDNEIEQWGV